MTVTWWLWAAAGVAVALVAAMILAARWGRRRNTRITYEFRRQLPPLPSPGHVGPRHGPWTPPEIGTEVTWTP